MSDEPKKMGTTNCTPYMTTEKNCRFSLKLSHRFSVKETDLPQKEGRSSTKIGRSLLIRRFCHFHGMMCFQS